MSTAPTTEDIDRPERPVFAGVSRNVLLLSIVSFFADFSSEMVYPLVPLFLTSALGAPVFAVGLIEGAAESTASLLKFVVGWSSDRFRRRRPFTLAGYGIAAIAKPALAAATVWPAVLAVRVLDRTGKGIRGAPRDALLAESTTPETRGRAFGLHRTFDTAGAIAGPLTALALLFWFGQQNYRPVFVIAFIPGLISVLALLLVKEIRHRPSDRPLPPLLSLRGYDRTFLAFVGVTLLFSLGNSSDAFLVLRSQDLGLGAVAIVFAYVLYNITYSSLSLPAGISSDRLGRRVILVAGFLIFAAVYAGFALATGSWMVWVLFVVYGAYIAFTDGISKAYISDLVPAERRGGAIGLYNAGTGIMLLLSSLLGGALWDLVGPPATFAFGASTALAAAALMLLLPSDRRPTP